MNRRLIVLAAALNLVAAGAAMAQPYQDPGRYPQSQGQYGGPPQEGDGYPQQQGPYGPPPERGYDGPPPQGPYGPPPHDGYGGPPPPGQYGPPPPEWDGGSRHWQRHVRHCFAQHQNYDPRSNTYVNSRGYRRTCH